MKMQCVGSSSLFLLLATCVCASGLSTASHKSIIRFGPNDCVRVTKSSAGSCVISTRCIGLDISKTEFAFNCVKKHGITQRHSYGTGGFEHNEEFDSEVKCHKCDLPFPFGAQFTPPGLNLPSPHHAALPGQHHTRKHAATASKHVATASVAPVSISPPKVNKVQHTLPRMVPKPPVGILNAKWRHLGKHPATATRLKTKHHFKNPTEAHEEVYRLTSPTAAHHRGHNIRLRAKHHSAKAEKSKASASTAWSSVSWPWTTGQENKPEAKEPPQMHDGKKSAEPEPKNDVVKYGPKNCVSTYRNAKGNCVVQTKCSGVNISDYEFGVLCIDQAGVPVRHLFGRASFGQDEKFDTLLKCNKCSSHDSPHHIQAHASADTRSQLGAVMALSKEVEDLTKMVSNISSSVQRLNTAVFKHRVPPAAAAAAATKPPAGTAPTKPPASAAPNAAPAAAAAAKVNFLHRAEQHHDHKKAAYIQSRLDKDDNEDEEDDEDDDGGYDVDEEAATRDRDAGTEKRESEDDDNEYDNANEDQEEAEAANMKHEQAQRSSSTSSEAADENDEDVSDEERYSDAGTEHEEDADKHRQEDDDKHFDEQTQRSSVQLTSIATQTAPTQTSTGSLQNVEAESHQQVLTQKSKDDGDDGDDGKELDVEDVVSMGPSKSTEEVKKVPTQVPEESGDVEADDDTDTDGFA